MHEPPFPLLIAATRLELAPLLQLLEDGEELRLRYGEGLRGRVRGVPVALAWFGLAKTNTAAGLALALETLEPDVVIQLGIGGAFPRAPVEIGSASVASEEVHLDCGAITSGGFDDMEALGFPLLGPPRPFYNTIPVDAALAASLAGDRWPLLPFGTAETISGTKAGAGQGSRFTVSLESMEGAAAAQVCLALGARFGEVRGVSNLVGERDKSRWLVGAAVTAANRVVDDWLSKGSPLD